MLIDAFEKTSGALNSAWQASVEIYLATVGEDGDS